MGRGGDLTPAYTNAWQIGVLYGPHGAPDFFRDEDIAMLFDTDWKVHHQSDRTGVRLIGPKPQWARLDGGEAGLHPSNLHDNAYAIGAIDFTGDMPIILGPDGPSLGGFVCPAAIVHAELWKVGQLRPGDTVRFHAMTYAQADAMARQLEEAVASLHCPAAHPAGVSGPAHRAGHPGRAARHRQDALRRHPRRRRPLFARGVRPERAGSGPALPGPRPGSPASRAWPCPASWTSRRASAACTSTTTPRRLPREALLEALLAAEQAIPEDLDIVVPSRILHLPLSWDDPETRLAAEKYMQSVRPDAPWCPDNIEFIRRINGLGSREDVQRIIFDASYLVLGLGDVYLGRTLATPTDPRHRLVTTKYNPARTWTPENAVGIGGAYLCIYGMEGPGGYQLFGRTIQIWNTFKSTQDFEPGTPWLLRFFDQIRFYPVGADELLEIRDGFPHGEYPLTIEPTEFRFRQYQAFLDGIQDETQAARSRQQEAFAAERARWAAAGQLAMPDAAEADDAPPPTPASRRAARPSHPRWPPASGRCWWNRARIVAAGEALLVLEAMKTETVVTAPRAGVVEEVRTKPDALVMQGQNLVILRVE